MTEPMHRRDFLAAGAATIATAALPTLGRAAAPSPAVRPMADACIFINLVGGPSQLDTWDPKPDAPSTIRGPFTPIRTSVPGVLVSELFPKMAANAHRFSMLRGMHHTLAPIHETGLQLLNAGHYFGDGPEWPSVGAVVAEKRAIADYNPFEWVVMPYCKIKTGVHVSHGQDCGWLTRRSPAYYGWDDERPTFADVLDQATRFATHGTPFVTVNMYETVFDAVSWDCHADRGSLATDLGDYKNVVAPVFDNAFTSLLDQLEDLGRLDRTLVVATGEFGRTPKLNSNGGRDHWPACWTALVAGGGTNGGRIVGASDAIGSEPAERPITPQELVATIYRALGIGANATIPGPDGKPVNVCNAASIHELF